MEREFISYELEDNECDRREMEFEYNLMGGKPFEKLYFLTVEKYSADENLEISLIDTKYYTLKGPNADQDVQDIIDNEYKDYILCGNNPSAFELHMRGIIKTPEKWAEDLFKSLDNNDFKRVEDILIYGLADINTTDSNNKTIIETIEEKKKDSITKTTIEGLESAEKDSIYKGNSSNMIGIKKISDILANMNNTPATTDEGTTHIRRTQEDSSEEISP